MIKRNRKLALLLAWAVCFVVLFSALYIAAEADHDCVGASCPICYQIGVCENALKLTRCAAVAMVVAIALTFTLAILSGQPKTRLKESTLIALKVKLSN